MGEAKHIVDDLLSHAREKYELNNLISELKKLSKLMDDPGYIQDKSLALSVCNAMIHLSLEKGAFKNGSIAHKLGLRLYDYIGRSK